MDLELKYYVGVWSMMSWKDLLLSEQKLRKGVKSYLELQGQHKYRGFGITNNTAALVNSLYVCPKIMFTLDNSMVWAHIVNHNYEISISYLDTGGHF